MILQTLDPFTVQLSRDGSSLGTVQLTPRQSWRLAQFAAANEMTLPEMLALAVSSLTEADGPCFTLPDEVKKAEEEEHKMKLNLRDHYSKN